MDKDQDDDLDPAALGRALLVANAADPGQLVDRLRAEFLSDAGLLDLTLHLIDYRLVSLRPIEFRDRPALLRPESVDDSVLGEAFRSQRATGQRVPIGYLQHVPVSVRGQRLGVLSGTYGDEPSVDDLRVLRSLALAIAHSLFEAGAGSDVYEIGRRHGRMSVAAEMQWQLLPARAYETSHFYVAGHLEPALRIAGDAFDFVVNDSTLILAVIDATGTGGAPSLVTTLAVSALRNARRAGLSLSEQASLTSDVIWQQAGGAEHVSALLLELDSHTGRASAVDAGSPLVVRRRDGRFDTLDLDGQTPMGMFEATDYAEEVVDLRPGDFLYVFTDGAFSDGRSLAEITDLLEAEHRDATSTPPESIRSLVAQLTDGGQEPEDDITVVCVNWKA